MPDPLASVQRFYEALSSSSQKRVVRVDVYNGSTFIQSLPIADNTSNLVTVDTTATTRRTLTLTVIDQGIAVNNPNSLVPNAPTDLLHPLSGNELHVFRGFEYPDGSQDLCQLGVFRMSQPQITDTGDAITITITGNDRSAEISRLKWTDPYQVVAGTDLSAAVRAILHDRWQGEPLDLSRIESTNPIGTGQYGAGSFLTLPNTTFGTDLANTNDPWADLQTLVLAAGMELFFDTQGRPVMQSIVNPVLNIEGASFPGLYDDLGDGMLLMAERVLDETRTFSGVIGIGNGTGTSGGVAIPPVTSKAVSPSDGQMHTGIWNTDPASPSYYDPGNPDASFIGAVPFIFETQAIPGPGDSEFTAQIKINAAALAQLQLILTAYENPDFTCVPNPALWENDIIFTGRKRAGINANYVVSGMTIPLDVATTMAVTLKPRLQPAVVLP